ncbi:ExeA family protein [Ideonella sp. BN130291]|uniref:ExeA family protein n=1 Tax=Ideonella sp. BN130291 TaxID=3112940 RepID=UPI002E258F98|nr:AAA family ATPase [Ideonella sp. BN130291]
MVESFFGLKCEPFSVAPDPRFLYLSEQHREALAHLTYGLHRGAGFVLLTGEIGAGKTTVWRHFLEHLPPQFDVANVVNPRLGAQTLLARVCDDLNIERPAADAGVDLIDVIHGHLLLAAARGRRTLIVVDEAQALSTDVLEQLRLLTNLDTSGGKLQVLLIGQPELRTLLERPELEPLAQRVVARFHLAALPPAETARYIAHRMAVAGLEGPLPFQDDALQRIHSLCRGVPRRINVLCDRALLLAQASNSRQVDRALVDRAAADVFGALLKTRAPAPPHTGRLVAGGVAVLAVAAGLVVLGPMAQRAWAPERATGQPLALAAVPAPAATASRSVASALPAAPASTTSTASAAPAASPPPGASAASPATPTPVPELPAKAGPSTAPRLLQSLDALFVAGAADERRAWRELAGLWGAALPGDQPCAVPASSPVHCYRSRGGLGPIRQLARPGIVNLADAQGRMAQVLLTGLSAHSATLRLDGGEYQVPLGVLAQAWRGEFATLWRAPPGYRPGELVSAGSPLATWLAQRLAAIDGQPATGLSDEALKARVFAFQLAHGLPPDGLAGPLTLMQINQASAVDEPRLRTAATP